MVSTVNDECSQFFSTVTEHRAGEELSNDIGVGVIMAVKRYKEIHGFLPQRIVFYRDGVGDGQLHQVKMHEVTNIKSKLDKIYKERNEEYKFTFLIVNKRINTRLFYNGRNPPPGKYNH